MTLLKGMEFAGIEIFDKDFYNLILLFSISFLVTFVLARFIYYPKSKQKKEFLFTYLLVGSIIFFLCFALKSFKFSTGAAIGLFALFGIIRFRTDAIPVKEMTYLFAIIGISMINAFSKKMSLIEVGFINLFILVIAYFMERFINQPKTKIQNTLKSKNLTYGNLNYIKPQNKELLLTDLKEQTGLNIEEIKIGKINLKAGEAEIKIYFNAE